MNAKYEYECLKLGDADAIVICHYFVNGNQEFPFLILIDSGKENNGTLVAAHLSEYYGTKHINLAVCTHPDSDHKDGFFDLLEDPDVTIDEFWLVDPAEYLKPEYRNDKSSVDLVRRIWNKSSDPQRNLIEELEQKGVKVQSVSANERNNILTVVAPAREYYMGKLAEMVELEGKKKHSKVDTSKYDENAEVDEDEVKSVIDECTDDSPTNASSIVLLYEPGDGKRLLFTGDATQESLQWAIDNFGLNDIDFLKVPHHGSKHNLTTPIIDTLAPKKSYITAAGTSKHPSSAVVYWLSKHGDVYSTHPDNVHNYLHCGHNVPSRKGCGTIDPFKKKQKKDN